MGAVHPGFAGVVQQRELCAGVATSLKQRRFVRGCSTTVLSSCSSAAQSLLVTAGCRKWSSLYWHPGKVTQNAAIHGRQGINVTWKKKETTGSLLIYWLIMLTLFALKWAEMLSVPCSFPQYKWTQATCQLVDGKDRSLDLFRFHTATKSSFFVLWKLKTQTDGWVQLFFDRTNCTHLQ